MASIEGLRNYEYNGSVQYSCNLSEKKKHLKMVLVFPYE